jgi:hypothetical protein
MGVNELPKLIFARMDDVGMCIFSSTMTMVLKILNDLIFYIYI